MTSWCLRFWQISQEWNHYLDSSHACNFSSYLNRTFDFRCLWSGSKIEFSILGKKVKDQFSTRFTGIESQMFDWGMMNKFFLLRWNNSKQRSESTTRCCFWSTVSKPGNKRCQRSRQKVRSFLSGDLIKNQEIYKNYVLFLK